MRYALALDLVDDAQRIADYEKAHERIWPEVRDHLTWDRQAQVLAAAQAAIESLPPYQRPEKIHLVDHFPRTDTGKLRRVPQSVR